MLEGRVPGSLDLDRGQRYLQPPKDSTDVLAVIRGVIRAEDEAVDQYKKIIKMCDPIDLVTQDLILEITAQEQAHRRQLSDSFTSTNVAKQSDSLPPQRNCHRS